MHAPKVSSVVAVHDLAVGQDVSESAFLAELAVSLRLCQLWYVMSSASHTFVKYLQGARSVMGSSEWRNGQAFPAWHAPCR
jgi:hypothetical protein